MHYKKTVLIIYVCFALFVFCENNAFAFLYRSTDGGHIWKQIDSKQLNIVAFALLPNRNIVGLSENGSLYVMDVEKKRWKQLSNRKFCEEKCREGNELLVSPLPNHTLYLFSGVANLHFSSDNGKNWKEFKDYGSSITFYNGRNENYVYVGTWVDVLKCTEDMKILKKYSLSGSWIGGIAVDGNNPGKIITSQYKIFLTEDEGKTWKIVFNPHDKKGDYRIFQIIGDPRSNKVYYSGLIKGIIKTEDGGNNWKYILREHIRGFVINPYHPDKLMAWNAKLHLSYDGGKSWEQFDGSELSGDMITGISFGDNADEIYMSRVYYTDI